MKKEDLLKVFVLLFLLLVLFFPVKSLGETIGNEKNSDPSSPSFWQDPNAIQSASPDQVISGINSGAVTVDNVNNIPAGTLSQVVGSLKDEHVKVLEQLKIDVIGISKFSNTQRQILKESQVSKKALNDLSSSQWSSLSRETLNGVLSRESGRVVDVHLGSGDVGGEGRVYKIRDRALVV